MSDEWAATVGSEDYHRREQQAQLDRQQRVAFVQNIKRLVALNATARDIPLRDVLGEPPTRAIRRWMIDSPPYAIGTEPPTLSEVLDSRAPTTETPGNG